MKATDVRLNNLFKEKYSGEIIKVIGITPEKIVFSGVFYERWQAEPMPLDEAWLIKMQFHRWGESNTFGNGKVIIHKRKRGWVINTKIPVMESVHQFMNYHYAVTGVELTVSE